MRPDKLEEMIIQHKKEGRRPFFVNCTSGTTVMGAFDPINAIADVCERQDLWMHIDVNLFIVCFFTFLTLKIEICVI